MPEKFDFSKPEDQKRFENLLPGEKAKTIDDAQAEAVDINERVSGLVDRLTLKANLAESIGEVEEAKKIRAELQQAVATRIEAVDTKTRETIKKIMVGLDTNIPAAGLEIGIGTALQSPDMNSIARVLGKGVTLIQRANEPYQENAILVGKMGDQFIILTHLGKLFPLSGTEWANALNKAKQPAASEQS